jgi:hypothetical protein
LDESNVLEQTNAAAEVLDSKFERLAIDAENRRLAVSVRPVCEYARQGLKISDRAHHAYLSPDILRNPPVAPMDLL